MPAKWFRCPDDETIEISTCLSVGGCRMKKRCATVSFLTLAGYDRKWQGVSPSSAGNGPRLMYLKATTDYIVTPTSRTFALLGTAVHEMLAGSKYTKDVLAEEKLSDDEIEGTADALEPDEYDDKYYVLTDHKTSGSFKVAKWLGIVSEKYERLILDDEDKPVLLKSGKNKGQPKTKKLTTITKDPLKVDIRAETLQTNRYRLLYEQKGFPISRMQIQAIPRDGNTWVAKNRGITEPLYIIPIKRLTNKFVLEFYKNLADEVNEAFKTNYARLCNSWEAWDGRRKCEMYCEVQEACIEMSKKHGERRGIL